MRHRNISKEEWEAIRAPENERTLFIKKDDKGSCAVVWDRVYYLLEAEKQLNFTSTYKSIEFKERLLTDFVECSNNFLGGFKSKRFN